MPIDPAIFTLLALFIYYVYIVWYYVVSNLWMFGGSMAHYVVWPLPSPGLTTILILRLKVETRQSQTQPNSMDCCQCAWHWNWSVLWLVGSGLWHFQIGMHQQETCNVLKFSFCQLCTVQQVVCHPTVLFTQRDRYMNTEIVYDVKCLILGLHTA